ncbi:MAG: hypothetical protein ACYDDF_09095 [Thermoplasmatota archaeon]
MAAAAMSPDAKVERVPREVAQRLFAAEFAASNLEFREGGDKAPTFVISPLGARVNRLLLVGILTANETVGTTGDTYRAQITDPTGIVNVYAGQYQPEAAAALADVRPPAVVAVVGKARTYRPDPEARPTVVYTSVRPETISLVEPADRDAWVLETARHTLLRLDCMKEAAGMANATVAALVDLGYPADLADGVVRALAHYGRPDLARWGAIVRDAIEAILPGGTARPSMSELSFAPASALVVPSGAGATPGTGDSRAAPLPAHGQDSQAAEEAAVDAQEAIETEVFALVESLDEGKGAPWEEVVAAAGKKRLTEADVEEALNRLMDKGRVYEPVLGRLKKT